MFRVYLWGISAITYIFIPEAEFGNKTILICLCILMAFDRLLKESN